MIDPTPPSVPTPARSPYLPVQGAAALIAFLEQALGAQLRLRVEDPPGRVRHAELRIADGVVMLEVYRRALALGGRAVRPPGQTPGDPDRRAGFADPFENSWWIATRVAPIP